MYKEKLKVKGEFLFLMIALLLITQESYAIKITQELTIGRIVANLQPVWTALIELTTIVAYCGGLYLVGYGLKKYVTASRPGQGATFSNASLTVLAGIFLIYTPYMIRVMVASLDGDFGRMSYVNDHQYSLFTSTSLGSLLNDQGLEVFKSIITLLKLVGYVAIVKGFFLLRMIGAPGGQNVSMFKIILHWVGGVGLILIVDIAKAFGNQTGITFTL